MAQETETLLFEVILDIPKVKENSEIALAALNRLRAEKEKTQKLFESKLLGEAVYKKTMQALQVEIDKTEKELAGYTKTLAEHEQRQQAAEKGVQRLTNGLAALTPKVDKLDSSQTKAALSSDELTDKITSLNNQFKNEQAIAKALTGSMDDLDDQIADLEEQYRQLSKAKREDAEVGGVILKQLAELNRVQEENEKIIDDSKEGLTEYLRGMNVLGVNIGETADKFQHGVKGAKLFSEAISTSRGALIGLIAVPFIAAIVGLYLVLTKSQRGMDFLAKATAGVSAIFSAFSNKIIDTIKLLSDAWNNPKQAVIDFGNYVQQNLINRFTALGVVIDGIRSRDWGKVADGLVQMSTGAEQAATRLKKVYDTGVAIANLEIQIKEAEIKLNTERARSERFIERQKQIAEDTTKSVAVRQKAERLAYAESVKIQNSEMTLQQKRIDLAKAQSQQNRNIREARAKVGEEESKLDDLAKDRIGERTELQNQLNAIEAEGAQKAEERAKKLAADKVAEAEAALLQAKKNGESTIQLEEAVLTRQIELIRARTEAEKVGKNVSVAQKKQIDAQAQADELEAIKAHARLVEERTFAIQENQIAAKLALVRKGTQAEYDLQQKALTARLDREKSAAADSIHNDKERTAELRRLDALYNADSEALAQQFEQTQVQQEADHAEQVLQIRQNAAGLSLADQRKLAADRIKLEEKTQLALLEIEKKYALKQTSPTDNDAREKVEKDFATRRQGIASKTSALLGGLERDANAEAINNARARAETSLALSKAGSQAELEARIDMIHAQRMAELNNANLTADERVAINAKANRAIGDAEDEFLKKQIGQVLDVYSKATSVAADFINTQIGNQQKALDDQQEAALGSAALNAEARTAIEADYQKKKAKLEKEAAQKRKDIAMVETLINTAKAVVEAAPNPFLMALAGAVGALQLGIISSQQFALGGVSQAPQGPVFGPSHAQGGIQLFHKSGAHLGEMEGREIILTKGVYEDPVLRAKASALNVAGGGISFANIPTGPTYRPSLPLRMAMGGVARYYQQQSTTAGIDYGRMEQIMIRAISSLPPPEVQVKTIRSAVAQQVRVENRVNK